MGRTAIAFVIVAGLTALLDARPARCVVEDLPWTHVKAADPIHRALLLEGFERSATFRHLVGGIEASSWLVFVQTGRCPEKLAVACLLHFVGTFEGTSYLRVIARRGRQHPDNVIAILAHELQHAREVVEAGGINDPRDLGDLFRRIGYVSVMRPGVMTYETDQAVQVGNTVWRELIHTPSRRCR